MIRTTRRQTEMTANAMARRVKGGSVRGRKKPKELRGSTPRNEDGINTTAVKEEMRAKVASAPSIKTSSIDGLKVDSFYSWGV